MDKMDFAIQVLVIGFFVVMFTLFTLYGILALFSRLFYKKDNLSVDAVQINGNYEGFGNGMDSNRRTTAAIVAAVYQYMNEVNISNTSGRLNIAIQPADNFKSSNWRILGRKNFLDNRIDLENNRRKKKSENI